jgi:hybrid cluster-associated redox disulfide protein
MRHQPAPPDENSTIEAVLRAHPAAARVLLRHGMACVGCAMAPYETLAEAAREYRVRPRALLEELAAAAAPAKHPPSRERAPRPHATPAPRRRARPEQGRREDES